MKKFFILTAFLFFITALPPAYAQAPVSEVAQDVTGSSASSQQDIQDLVDTLEDPAKRVELVNNLKILIDENKDITDDAKDDGEDESNNQTDFSKMSVVSDALNLEEQTEVITSEFNQFLDEYGLNNTNVMKTLSTIGLFFIFWIFSFIALRLSRSFRDFILPKAEKYYINTERLRIYNRLLRYFVYILFGLILIYTTCVIWGLTEFAFLDNQYFIGFISNSFSFLIIVLFALTLWEGVNGAIEFAMTRATGKYSKRVQTLLPIVKNVLFFVFSVMFTLVLLSELGVDIVPLLAGAGVVGIAVGFGAQTMVKDFLTGFIIIMEDLIQVGDVASLGGKTGLIEKITIRKVQLRDLDGSVYTVPFSEISIVSNLTKDYSYYLMDIGIAYREDPDEVIGYLREIDEEMRNDENFKDLILEELHILGVDAFGDSAIIIKARIKTLPIKQWDVGREFNRRMKYKFDKHGIEIPFPHQTIYFGEDKEGKAPPAYIQLTEKQKEQTQDKESPKAAKKKGKANAKKEAQNTAIPSTDDVEDE